MIDPIIELLFPRRLEPLTPENWGLQIAEEHYGKPFSVWQPRADDDVELDFSELEHCLPAPDWFKSISGRPQVHFCPDESTIDRFARTWRYAGPVVLDAKPQVIAVLAPPRGRGRPRGVKNLPFVEKMRALWEKNSTARTQRTGRAGNTTSKRALRRRALVAILDAFP